MKPLLLAITFVISFCFLGKAQSYKKIKDPALLAQEKRMVFEKWGDWKPDPVYPKLFGIRIGENISPHYAIAWGKWLAPRRNRRYKNGPDIRPLRAGGEETNRLMNVLLMKKQAELIQKSVDSIRKSSQDDMLHWTHLTVNADPLYLLYYKKMLEPLQKFPTNPNTYKDWGFESKEVLKQIKETGQLDVLKEKLFLSKDTYQKAKKLDMPRGKRFLMFHKSLIKWREFESLKNQLGQNNSMIIKTKEKQKIKLKEGDTQRSKTDREIAEEIIKKFKHQF